MSNLFRWVFYLLCLLNLLHCGDFSPEDRSVPNMEPQNRSSAQSVLEAKGVSHFLTIGDDSTNLLYNVTSLVISEEPFRIIALDRGSYQIKTFDAAGRLLATVGSKGSGPGEFRNPTMIGHIDDYLVVSEQFSPRGHLFSPDLRYERDVLLEIQPVDMTASSGGLLMTGFSLKNAGAPEVGVFSLAGPKYHAWSLPAPKLPQSLITQIRDNPLVASFWSLAYVAANDEKVWLAFAHQNIIRCVSNKRVLWEKSAKGLPDYADIEKNGRMPLPNGKIFQDIAVDEASYSFVLTGDYGAQPSRLVFVYSPDGERVDTLVLPYQASAIEWSEPNNLYAIDLNRIRIRGYRITSDHESHQTRKD